MDDVSNVQAVFGDDPRVTNYVQWKPKATEEESEYFLRILVDGADNRRPSWWLVRRSDAAVVGTIIAAWDSSGEDVETSYVITHEHWGHGYATEAVELVVRFVFATTSACRVTAVCAEENPASARVLEKAGFKPAEYLPAFAKFNVSPEPRDCRRYVRERQGPLK